MRIGSVIRLVAPAFGCRALCALLATLALVATAAAQERPRESKLLDKPGFSIFLEAILFDEGAPTDPAQAATGVGDFVVSHVGKVDRSALARVTNLRQRPDGSTLQVTVNLTQPLAVTDFARSTIDLNAPTGSALTFDGQTLRITAPSAASRVELGLPFRISDGTFAKLAASELVIATATDGFQLSLENASVLSPQAGKSIDLGVAVLKTTGVADIDLTFGGGQVQSWKTTLSQANVSLDIPILPGATNKPIEIQASDVQIDQDGALTFSSVTTDFPATNRPTIGLANPGGFDVIVKRTTVAFTDGSPTSYSMICDVRFPPDFKTAGGGRLLVSDVNVAAAADDGPLIQLGTVPEFTWRGTTMEAQDLTLDLSSTQPVPGLPSSTPAFIKANEWMGVYVKQGKMKMPATMLGPDGQPVKLEFDNFAIEKDGPTGKVTVDNANGGQTIKTLAGFNVKSIGGSIELTRGKFTNCTVDAGLDVPLSTSSTSSTTVNVRTTFDNEGFISFDVKNTPPLTLKLDQAGLLIEVQRGRLIIDPGEEPKIIVTGDLTFDASKLPGSNALPTPVRDALTGARMHVQDIGFDGAGRLDLPSDLTMNLAQPLVVDLKIIKLEGRSLGFELDSNDKLVAVTLSGGAQTGDELDIPVKGGIDFEGIRVGKDGDDSDTLPDVSIKKLDVNLQITELLTVDGSIEFKRREGFGNTFGGRSKLSLGGIGGFDVLLLMGEGGWFVGGGLEITPPVTVSIPTNAGPVPIFNIYGGFGGFGMNVEMAGPGQGRITALEQLNCKPGQNLAQVGLILGDQITGNVWWGQTTLTFGFPALTIDLTGQFAFLDLPPHKPGLVDNSYWDQASRVATIYANLDLSDLPNDMQFTVGGDTFLSIPERQGFLVAMEGEFQMKLSKTEKFVRAGWADKGQKPFSIRLGEVPAGIKLDIRGGMEVDFEKKKLAMEISGDFEANAGLHVDGSLEGTLTANLPEPLGTIPDANGHLTVEGNAFFPDFPDICANAYASLDCKLKSSGSGKKLSGNGLFRASVRVFGQEVELEKGFNEVLLEIGS